MSTSYHLKLDIKGFLKHTPFPSGYKGMFKHDDGSDMDPDAARDCLLGELERGHPFIPLGDCPTFDFKKGCPGHRTEEADDERG